MGELHEATQAQILLAKITKESLEETKKNNEATLEQNRLTIRQNRLTIYLTVAIIALGIGTALAQLFPIFEYKVINSSYLVRVNNITGNVKYIYILLLSWIGQPKGLGIG